MKGAKIERSPNRGKQRPFNGFLGTYKQKGQLDSFPMYIYDLLKYNEIRAGRGLIYFAYRTPRVFLFKIGFHGVRHNYTFRVPLLNIMCGKRVDQHVCVFWRATGHELKNKPMVYFYSNNTVEIQKHRTNTLI